MPLHDLFCRLVSIHNGHIEVHEYEAVFLLAALLVQVVVLEHIHRLQSVHGFVTLQIEVHLKDQLQWDQVEAVVVDYQN